MCVIAFSPRGVDIPSAEQIKQMWSHNPDGAGYAYVDKKGSVVFRKGFMTLAELMAELEAPERFKNTNFALHFRIGTSGKNDQATCHPFPLSTNFADLRKKEGKEEAVLFHNGVLSSGGIVSPIASDTQDFVVAMTPLLKQRSNSKARDYFMDTLIKGSRLLLLYKNNSFKMYGEWEKDGDIWVSNTYYKGTYSWYGSGYYGWNGYSDDFDDGKGYKLPNNQPRSYLKTYNLGDKRLKSEEALALWREVIKCGYKFVTDEELDMLKQSSHSYTRYIMELDEYEIGYDEQQMVVWLEDAPIQDNGVEEDTKEEE